MNDEIKLTSISRRDLQMLKEWNNNWKEKRGAEKKENNKNKNQGRKVSWKNKNCNQKAI